MTKHCRCVIYNVSPPTIIYLQRDKDIYIDVMKIVFQLELPPFNFLLIYYIWCLGRKNRRISLLQARKRFNGGNWAITEQPLTGPLGGQLP